LGGAEGDDADGKKEEERGAEFWFHVFLGWCGIGWRNITWRGGRKKKITQRRRVRGDSQRREKF